MKRSKFSDEQIRSVVTAPRSPSDSSGTGFGATGRARPRWKDNTILTRIFVSAAVDDDAIPLYWSAEEAMD